MLPRHAIPIVRGLIVTMLLLAAAPAGAESDQGDADPEAAHGAGDVGAPGHEPPGLPTPAQPAPAPATLPRSAPTPQPPPQAGTPPGQTESPKVLGRQFPAPVQPPAPPDDPEVHVTIVPPSEPRVGKNRLRQGNGGGSLQGADQGGADDGGLGDSDSDGDGAGD
jgi:hypothetical protein